MIWNLDEGLDIAAIDARLADLDKEKEHLVELREE
jgi:hypothetical protein